MKKRDPNQLIDRMIRNRFRLLIDAYLEKRLPPEEREWMEYALSRDPDLLAELAIRKYQLRDPYDRAIDRIRIRALFKEYVNR